MVPQQRTAGGATSYSTTSAMVGLTPGYCTIQYVAVQCSTVLYMNVEIEIRFDSFIRFDSSESINHSSTVLNLVARDFYALAHVWPTVRNRPQLGRTRFLRLGPWPWRHEPEWITRLVNDTEWYNLRSSQTIFT